MNTLKPTILLFLLNMICLQPKAQDIHLSQFAMSPMLLNPALVGFSQGDYRVYANFRTQWNTVANGSTYRTFAGGGDMAFGKANRYNSFGGVGISFFSDQAGAAGYQSNRVDASFAYHFLLSHKRNMSLSIGLQGSFNCIGFDPSKATYDYSYDPITGAIDPNHKEGFARTQVVYGDVGAGFFFNGNLHSRSDLYFGLSVSHINQPRISFFNESPNSSQERLYMKMSLHGGATAQIKDKLWLIPNFFIMIQGPAQQYNAGVLLKMQAGNKVLSKTFLYMGAQIRITHALVAPMADAIIIHSRLDYKGFTIGLSYDINISKLMPATSTFGAPEIGISYSGMTKHRPNPSYCPVML